MKNDLIRGLLEEIHILCGFKHKTSRKVAFYEPKCSKIEQCPNCLRNLPNFKFRRGKGCKWCQK